MLGGEVHGSAYLSKLVSTLVLVQYFYVGILMQGVAV